MVTLRPYQDNAVNAVRESFRAGNRRVLLVAPTGSGKTVIFSYMAARLAEQQRCIAIVVHRDELVQQVSASLWRFGVRHGIIAAGHSETSDAVQVCSVFTLARRLDRPGFRERYPFAFIIFDEAHHISAGSWGKVAAAWERAYYLGVTATPARLDGKGLKPSFDALVLGPSARQRTDDGYLVPAVVYAPPTNLDVSKLHTRAGDFDKGELGVALDKRQIYGSAVEHYRKLADGKPAVAFCASIQHAEHTADAFNAAGIPARPIDGKLNKTDRRARIEDLSKGRIQVLTSCDLISEGFDCPAITAAILLRPTKSLALYLQQVGRALRTLEGKERAIILDHVGNVIRHGMPDEEREWMLTDDIAVKKKSAAAERVQGYKPCLECYALMPSNAQVCTLCGAAFPAPKQLKEVAGELVEFGVGRGRGANGGSAGTWESDWRRLSFKQAIQKCFYVEDFYEMAAARQYSPETARHIIESRLRKGLVVPSRADACEPQAVTA